LNSFRRLNKQKSILAKIFREEERQVS